MRITLAELLSILFFSAVSFNILTLEPCGTNTSFLLPLCYAILQYKRINCGIKPPFS